MKVHNLVHLLLLALATSAAPLTLSVTQAERQHGKPSHHTDDTHHLTDSHLPDPSHRAPEALISHEAYDVRNSTAILQERGIVKPTNPKTTSTKASTSKAPNGQSDGKATRLDNLFAQLTKFSMATSFELEKPPAKGTNSLSIAAMKKAKIPPALILKTGNFDAQAFLRSQQHRLDAEREEYDDTVSLLALGPCFQRDCKGPVSGEPGLSHRLFGQLGLALNRVLRAIHANGDAEWQATGRGKAPIEDWRYHSESGPTLAVLELKTTDSMSNAMLQNIVDGIEAGEFTMTPLRGKGSRRIYSMTWDRDVAEIRDRRKSEPKILEQVSFI